MYIRNNNGPNIDPWGHRSHQALKLKPLILINCVVFKTRGKPIICLTSNTTVI